jgi:hypothetical protein
MNAAAILADLRAQGFTVQACDGKAVLSPGDRVTPDVIERVKANKPAILAELAAAEVAARGAADLEPRRDLVLGKLQADPSMRVAFDVRDVPMQPEAGHPVSLVLAVRTPAGIGTGELQIPRERFDMGLFLGYWQQQRRPA